MVIMTTKKPTVESRIFNVPKCIVFDVHICIFNVPKCIFNVPKESYQDISSHFHSVVSDIKLEDVCVSDRCNQIEDDNNEWIKCDQLKMTLVVVVLQAQGWEREEKRLKDQVAVQDIRITELEGAIQAISIEVKESKAALNENKEQYAILDKKYHKAKKLIKDLQEKKEELEEKDRLQAQIQLDKNETHQREKENWNYE
ncbi:hypothetical protein BSL78_18107 [Apostichopus japonicus]|uniref:Uncharacterized protein n=1 Tax=Stichopus japonicus TaxID=307972 RepID=A0A2G8KAM4_STIJA|nr:hypothetical protein BSL78_18107 [Apostichopus japonicus]